MQLISTSKRALYFLETRENALRMFDLPPALWVRSGEKLSMDAYAQVGEFFTFQVGVWAAVSATGNLSVVPSSSFPFNVTCFNTNGVDERGQHFEKNFNVAQGNVGSMWIGIDIPTSASPVYIT